MSRALARLPKRIRAVEGLGVEVIQCNPGVGNPRTNLITVWTGLIFTEIVNQPLNNGLLFTVFMAV